MQINSFIEALTEAKRKAQMAGRPVSEQEVRAVSGRHFARQGEELARQKRLQLQERGLKVQEKLGTKSLALARDRFEAEKEAAREARRRDKLRRITGLAGLGVGLAAGGPTGAMIGLTVAELSTGYL